MIVYPPTQYSYRQLHLKNTSHDICFRSLHNANFPDALFTASIAALSFACIPPVATPDSISARHAATVKEGIWFLSASRTPGTSVRNNNDPHSSLMQQLPPWNRRSR